MKDKIHILKSPLFITTAEDEACHGILPKGTALYYKKTFSEGFDRFCIYVNVEGPSLQLENTPKDNFEDPLTAYPRSDKSNYLNTIKEILLSFGISRSDLVEIISNYPV